MDIRNLTYEEALVLAYTGKEPDAPECRGFHWIGQSWASCDNCGRPVWEHEGMWKLRTGMPTSFLGDDAWHVDPFLAGEAERLRAIHTRQVRAHS